MSIATNMMILQVACKPNVYSNAGFSLGGGQSKMPNGDEWIAISFFVVLTVLTVFAICVSFK